MTIPSMFESRGLEPVLVAVWADDARDEVKLILSLGTFVPFVGIT
jgi:hypothetical protein